MEIIPVIDLQGGVAVRGQGGKRSEYKPLQSRLASGSAPLAIVAGLLSLHPFRTLYIADLDAIEGRGDATRAIGEIAAAFPDLTLWIDNGCNDPAAGAERFAASPSATLVLGSESQRDITLVASLRNHPRIVLSLDFRGDEFLGPPALLHDPSLWPQRLIVMTLGRVGSGAGPDLARLQAIKARADGRAVHIAGGLRDADDLKAAQVSGAAGVLVASALHDGRIGSGDIDAALGAGEGPTQH